MADLKRKDRILEIAVYNNTYELFQSLYVRYAKKQGWKSREAMLVEALKLLDTTMTLKNYN